MSPPRYRGEGNNTDVDLSAEPQSTSDDKRSSSTSGAATSSSGDIGGSGVAASLPCSHVRDRPWTAFGCALLAASCGWVALHRGAALDVACALLWAYGETSALPPVLAAHKRGRLAPGENPNPWVQNLLAAASRVPYFYNPATTLPFLVCLMALLAFGSALATMLVALRVTVGATHHRLTLTAWLGLMLPALLTWKGSRGLQGSYFVVVLTLNRLSYMTKIPYAIRTRDGSFFADAAMMAWNMACAVIWVYYGLTLSDGYIVTTNSVAIACTLPCLVLKLALHPSCFGRSKEQLEALRRAEAGFKTPPSLGDDDDNDGKEGGEGGVEMLGSMLPLPFYPLATPVHGNSRAADAVTPRSTHAVPPRGDAGGDVGRSPRSARPLPSTSPRLLPSVFPSTSAAAAVAATAGPAALSLLSLGVIVPAFDLASAEEGNSVTELLPKESAKLPSNFFDRPASAEARQAPEGNDGAAYDMSHYNATL